MRRVAVPKRIARSLAILLIAAAWAIYAAKEAAASIVLSISPATTTVAPGSAGDSFNVTLTNTGPSSVAIEAFVFDLTNPGSLITYTGVTPNTTPSYIFGGTGLGPSIANSVGVGSVDAEDVTSTVGGVSVGAGATVGLGHVVFSVSSTATTTNVPVSFVAFPSTGFSDPNLTGMAFNTLTGGTISIQNSTSPGSVPEPSAFIVWAGIGAIGLLGYARRRHLCQARCRRLG